MSENGHTSQQVSPSPHQVDSIGAHYWCDTRQKEAHFTYVWNIHDFKSFPEEVGGFIKSSKFSPNDDCKTKLRLNLYAGGYRKENINYVSLFLYLVSSDKDELRIRYKLTILNNKKQKSNELGDSTNKFNLTNMRGWGYREFIHRVELLNPLKGLLSDGNLCICCEGSVMKDPVHISGKSSQFKFPACRLTDNFNALLDSEKFSDVTLVVSGSELRAHKAILAAQSAVFAAMFKHEMKEHEQNCVNITDINYETLREIIRFMYTGRVFNLDTMASDLLVAADKYALERLKVMCEESLFNNISIETATETLILADMHSAEQLKIRTIDFIVNGSHIMAVMNTSGWKNVVSSLPHLVTEVILALATQQQNLPTGPQ